MNLMNKYRGISILTMTLLLSSISFLSTANSTRKEYLFSISLISDTLPPLNNDIIAYVDAHLHQKVGYGECWDLAAIPLNNSNVRWDKKYVFGKLLNPEKDSILPGDIVQFEGVVIKTRHGNSLITSYLEHHTAIIYTVLGNNRYTLAQQNTSDLGRKVGFSDIDLSNLVKGRYMIYRPTK